MKKTIFIFLIIITSFIFIDSVYASVEESITINYKLEIINYNDLSDEEKENIYYNSTALKSEFEQLISYFENQSNYDSYIIITNSAGNRIRMFMYNKNSSNNILYFTGSHYMSNNTQKFNLYYSLLTNDYSNLYYYINFNNVTTSSIPDNWKYSNEVVNSIIYNNIHTRIDNTSTTNNKIYVASNNLEKIVYSTDLTFIDYDNIATYNNVYYNDELLFTNNQQLNKSNYTYENLIETTGIDKVEIIFDTSKKNFDFDLEFLMQFSDIHTPKPYLESTGLYNNEYITQIEDFVSEMEDTNSTDINGVEVYQYSGNFGLDFINNYGLKIVIDVSSTIDDLYLNFTSSIDYEISLIETIKEVNYKETIWIDNIYGIYLIPKVLNNDNFVPIYLNGLYNIQIIKDFYSDNSQILNTYLDFNNSFFQYKNHYTENNNLIYIENKNYNTELDDTYYITYDTRYFNYTIKKEVFDIPTIINPNTNEEQIIQNIIIESEKNNNSFFTYIKSVFNFFITPITHIFSLITTFYTTLPTILQYLFSGIFILAIFYYIIKFIL